MSIREHNYNKYIRSPGYSHPNNIESHIIRWTTLHVRSCSTTATAFSGRSFQPWVFSALRRFDLGRFGLSRFGPGSFRLNLVGRFGLIVYGKQDILDRFCFGLRLIQAPIKPAGYHSGSGTCRAKTISCQDISSGSSRTTFRLPRPVFYNGL